MLSLQCTTLRAVLPCSTHPQGMTAYTATSGTLSVVCGRLSFTFGLKVG